MDTTAANKSGSTPKSPVASRHQQQLLFDGLSANTDPILSSSSFGSMGGIFGQQQHRGGSSIGSASTRGFPGQGGGGNDFFNRLAGSGSNNNQSFLSCAFGTTDNSATAGGPNSNITVKPQPQSSLGTLLLQQHRTAGSDFLPKLGSSSGASLGSIGLGGIGNSMGGGGEHNTMDFSSLSSGIANSTGISGRGQAPGGGSSSSSQILDVLRSQLPQIDLAQQQLLQQQQQRNAHQIASSMFAPSNRTVASQQGIGGDGSSLLPSPALSSVSASDPHLQLRQQQQGSVGNSGSSNNRPHSRTATTIGGGGSGGSRVGHQQQQTSTSSAATSPSSPTSVLGSDYGLLPLLKLVSMSDADRCALALGPNDPTLLGMNLSTVDRLYRAFVFIDDDIMDFSIPSSTLSTSSSSLNIGGKMSATAATSASGISGLAREMESGVMDDSSKSNFLSHGNITAAPSALTNNGSTKGSPPTSTKPQSDTAIFHLPSCYYMNPPALKTGHLQKFQLETLFYIFYAMPRDILQAYAAQELYTRNWMYHGEMKMWFQRASPSSSSSRDVGTQGGERGGTGGERGGTGGNRNDSFVYFNVNSWERRLYNAPANASTKASSTSSSNTLPHGNAGGQNLARGFLTEQEVRVKLQSS